MAADNQAAGKKGPLVWQKPKMDHSRLFMLRLLSTPIPLVIICMRAKYPMIEQRKPNGEKEWIRSQTLEPKQADDILFEMFVHGWIDRDHKLHVTKYTRPDLAQVIRDGEPISIETGARLSAWSRGEKPAVTDDTTVTAGAAPATSSAPQPQAGAADLTTDEADAMLAEAAKKGMTELERVWKTEITADHRKVLRTALERRHKINAMKVA